MLSSYRHTGEKLLTCHMHIMLLKYTCARMHAYTCAWDACGIDL
jgi:hypothetical protein